MRLNRRTGTKSRNSVAENYNSSQPGILHSEIGLIRFLIIIIAISMLLMAQPAGPTFEVTNANQLGLTVWNYGVLGNGFNMIDGEILPSCQYRQNPDYQQEQVEHFSYAGIWIGGMVNGESRVSTAIIDGSFEPGQEGFEFMETSDIEVRSIIPESPQFNPDAVSHQDFLMDFKDYGNSPNDNFGINNHNPLGVNVHLETYTWNLTYSEGFVILNYTITNDSPDTIINIYAGIWVDPSVANMNHTNYYEPGGGFNWYDNLDGFDNSIDNAGFERSIGYQYDLDGDESWAESYIGFTALGGNVPRSYINIHYNQWAWGNSSNSNYPEYIMAVNDNERYEQLSTSVPPNSNPGLYTYEGYPNQPNSWLFMVSAGPFGSVPTSGDSLNWMLRPGETMNVQFALLTARWNGGYEESPIRRTNLKTYADRAQNVYNGEDLNRNNILDAGEDIDGDSELDRYFLPTDPPNNLTVLWNYPNVTLQWNPPVQLVQNYNIYKNQNYLIQLSALDTIFIDSTVADSGFSSFYVTSVNEWNLESAPSNTVRDHSVPPIMDFVYGSNPMSADLATDTSFTFPTRTFLLEVSDPDGIESVENIYYALDDTNTWIELPGYMRSLTLEELVPGFHTIFFKAVDNSGLSSATIQFPDTENYFTPHHWKVLPIVGDVLLVDDFSMDSQNDAQNWYKSILDTLSNVGEGNYSVWEIGKRLPYSDMDIMANLNYFDNVIWYTAYTGLETYSDASLSILSYAMNGGNIFMNVVDFRDTTFDWFPIDSLFTLNPSGRLFPGRVLTSQIDLELNLQTSYTIGVRVKGFEFFMGDSLNCPQYRSLYRMQEPEENDEWIGTPNVCGVYTFQRAPDDCSGKVILMSLPLHSGYSPLMEGNGSAGKFIRYLLEEEFTVGILEDVTTLPTNFFLQQNFPNPFNPITAIQYEIPKRSDVQITIYDILGRKVTTLISETQEAGYKSIEWNASRVASGMYFYQIRAGEFVQTRKMVLLK